MNVPPKNPRQRAALTLSLRRLRDFNIQAEFGLHGPDAIIAYLNQLGVKNGMGKAPTKWTVYEWIRKRGFPAYVPNRRNGMMTTNFLILAWLWSFRVWQQDKPYRSPKFKVKTAIVTTPDGEQNAEAR